MRVVSLVPSLTETLCELGLDDRHLVGVTRWCIHPADRLGRVERVGGTKDPDVARIAALRPDLVVANWEENRKQDVEALQAAGIRVLVTDIRSIGDVAHAVRDLGRACAVEASAQVLAQAIDEAIAEAAAISRGRPTIPYYCPIWRRPWMTVNDDTYAASLLNLVGGENVYAAAPTRYPEADPADARARGARAGLLPSEPYPFAAKHVPELEAAGFDPAHVRLVDGESLTWYGARTPAGIADLLAVMEGLRPPGERDPRVDLPAPGGV